MIDSTEMLSPRPGLAASNGMRVTSPIFWEMWPSNSGKETRILDPRFSLRLPRGVSFDNRNVRIDERASDESFELGLEFAVEGLDSAIKWLENTMGIINMRNVTANRVLMMIIPLGEEAE